MISLKKLLTVGAISIAAFAMNVQGSGFAILEQTTPGLGRALAGIGADINEPGALFFNPAVSSWHKRPAIALGNTMLHVDAEFDIRSKSEIQGHDGGNGGGWQYIPHTYYVHPVSDRLAFGLGFSATSGTATNWNPHWAGNLSAVQTELKVINFTPSVSYKVLDNLSLGFGLTIDYADVTLSRAVVNPYHGAGPIFGASNDMYGFRNQYGQIKFRGDALTIGYTLGALYEPVKGTRIGLGYRSSVTHELDLEGRIRGVGPKKIKGDAECDLDVAGQVDLSIMHDINEAWTIAGSICWNRHSVTEELTVKFEKDALGTAVGHSSETIPFEWRDAWRFALGADYRYNEKLTFRFGAAYDQCAVDSPEYRVASIPDLNRIWLACGLSYKINENLTFDFGYVKLLFVKDAMETKIGDKKLDMYAYGDCDLISTGITFRF